MIHSVLGVLPIRLAQNELFGYNFGRQECLDGVFHDFKGDKKKDLTVYNSCPAPGYRGLIIEDTCTGVNGRLPPPPNPPFPPLNPPGGGWESRQGNCLPHASDNANLVYTTLEEAARECYSRPDVPEGEGCEGVWAQTPTLIFIRRRSSPTDSKIPDTASCNTAQGGITFFKPLNPP